jgi:hypothetical protein
MSERDPARRIMRLARALDTRALDALDPPAQGRKRAYACARHAPLLGKIWAVTGSTREPEAGSFVHDVF